LDSAVNSDIKTGIDKAMSKKVTAETLCGTLSNQKIETYLPTLINAALNAMRRETIINCWRKVMLWPPVSTVDLIAKLKAENVFKAEEQVAKRVQAVSESHPPTLEGLKMVIAEAKAKAALVTSKNTIEERAQAATFMFTIAVPDVVRSPQKPRKPIHGVGAGKYKGHYLPFNVGPRTLEMERILLEEQKQKDEAAAKRRQKVRRRVSPVKH
jgi:hypothetical protein